MKCIDYASGFTSSTPTKCKAAGVTVVIRYIGAGGDWKRLTKAEADSLRASGIQIAGCYETSAGWMLGGRAAGVIAAVAAQADTIKLGGSSTDLVWFACDIEVVNPADMKLVMECLDGAASILGKAQVGIYGSYAVVKAALEGSHAALGWQTRAWSGTPIKWLADPRCVLYQHNEYGYQYLTPDPVADYDYNEMRSPWVGQWGTTVSPIPGGETPPIEVTPPPIEVDMTKRDKYVAFLTKMANNPDAGDEYVWGAAGGTDRDKDGYPEADCSGLYHAALKAAGITETRTTADGYMHRGVAISKPTQIGDFATMHHPATHIVMYVGNGKTVEARGAAYGIDWGTVASVEARGGRWYRIKKYNDQLGGSSVIVPPVTSPDPTGLEKATLVRDSQGYNGPPTFGTKRALLKKGGEVLVTQNRAKKGGVWMRELEVGGKRSWHDERNLHYV